MKILYYTVTQVNQTRNHVIRVYMIEDNKLVKVYSDSIIISNHYKKNLTEQVERHIRERYQSAFTLTLERIK